MMDNDRTYFLDDDDGEDYDEESIIWNYNDWFASGIETSADLNNFFDSDLVRLTSLSPPNSTVSLDNSLLNSFSSQSSSSHLIYSFIDLTENCISPALSQLVGQLYWIVIYCCIFRLLCLTKFFSSKTLHYIQICASIFLLHHYFHFQIIFLLTYIFIAYCSFQLCLDKCRPYLKHIIVCFSVIYVLACEFLLIEQEQWHRIRGVQMCLMMKMISLAIDYDSFEDPLFSNTIDSTFYPTSIEFFSYILSIHNTIFGPWLNYRNYIHYFYADRPARKIDFFELVKWAYYFVRVALCLLVSTCFTDWFLQSRIFDSDEHENGGWRTAYIQALSYRFSHYCICFIGEFCGQISGLEFHVDEYRNYSHICQQAKERNNAAVARKTREQAEFEAAAADMHTGKRRHRTKKNVTKQDEQYVIAPTGAEEMNNDEASQISHATENEPFSTVESEPIANDEMDSLHCRFVVNRRGAKKSNSHIPPPSNKRKAIVRPSPLSSKFAIPSPLPSSMTATSISSSSSSSIVKPSRIELPHSLVDVVVNWNLPMHYWLKIYVYLPIKQRYGHFPSILITYLASALLHGFNFQLSIVLFSIGLFAYVEYGFRRKLAIILDACVGARTCPMRSSCEQHTHTYWHPLTLIVNIFLCLLSLWHLTYLGQLFDGGIEQTIGYSWQHVLDKWARLNFASHLVVIGTYAIFRSL